MTAAVSYAGARALVVGGFGYIGSHVTNRLIDEGAKVTIVTPDRARHAAAAERFGARGARIVEGDTRSVSKMADVVAGQNLVFSLSGRSGALRSVEDPAADLDVNCNGTLALLEAIRDRNRDAKLVFASSRLVYGAPTSLPVAENHPVAPLCPHGVHKAAGEQYLAIYGRLHGLRATSLRITNPYGTGQPSDRRAYGVINFLIHRAVAGETLPIYGDGAQLRDYVFIDDVVEALLRVGVARASDGRVYNVGSGVGTPMIDAARRIIATAGAGAIDAQPWPPLVHEIDTGDFVADVARIRDEIGWTPTVAFADGLRRTIAALTPASDKTSRLV